MTLAVIILRVLRKSLLMPVIYDTYASQRKYYLHENGKPLIALWG